MPKGRQLQQLSVQWKQKQPQSYKKYFIHNWLTSKYPQYSFFWLMYNSEKKTNALFCMHPTKERNSLTRGTDNFGTPHQQILNRLNIRVWECHTRIDCLYSLQNELITKLNIDLFLIPKITAHIFSKVYMVKLNKYLIAVHTTGR